MGQTADELRQEIDIKREQASEKISMIEERVTGATDLVKEQVAGAADQIKEQVTGAADQLKEQVKTAFDWRHQVEEKPLVALGAAFIGGVVLAGIMGGGDDQPKTSHSQPHYPTSDLNLKESGGQVNYSGGQQHQSGGLSSVVRKAAKDSGLEETISNMAGAFMGTLTERVKSMADQAFPGMADKLAEKAGKAPEANASDLPGGRPPSSAPMGTSAFVRDTFAAND